MASAGNHGRIIPRDREMLARLYWDERRTLPEIAALFGVSYGALRKVFVALEIPRRSRQAGKRQWRDCKDCGAPVVKILHRRNRSLYGKRCKECHRKYHNELEKKRSERPEAKERKTFFYRRWYYFGPLNPQGDLSWLRKGQSLLRAAKRTLAGTETRAPSPSLNVALKRGQTLPD